MEALAGMSPAGLGLVLEGLLGVVGGAGGVLHGALHVGIDPGNMHRGWCCRGRSIEQISTHQSLPRSCFTKVSAPVDHLSLVLDEHGDVHEHLVELLDRLLELDEHLVPVEGW